MTKQKKPLKPIEGNVQKDLFQAHIDFLNISIEEIKAQLEKVLIKIEQNDRTLLRNTIIVDEHHKRSTYLEAQQESILRTLKIISEKIRQLDEDVKDVNFDFKSIKNHVNEVNKLTKFFIVLYENKGLIFKVLLFIGLAFFTTYFGIKKSVQIMEVIEFLGK